MDGVVSNSEACCGEGGCLSSEILSGCRYFLGQIAEDVAWGRRRALSPSTADLERAQSIANGRGRSWREPADHGWVAREPISDNLRERFAVAYRALDADARTRRGIADIDAELPAVRASLDRFAIREALTELELLVIRRR